MKRSMRTGRDATPLRQRRGTGIRPVMHGRDAHATVGLARALVMTALALLPLSLRAAPFALTQDWSDTDTAGWETADGQTLLDTTDGALRITFPAQVVPAYASDIVWMPVPEHVRVTNIVFRLDAPDQPPSALRAVLAGRHSGITWFTPVVPPTAGTTVTFTVPASASSGWTPGVGHDAPAWDRDIHRAGFVGLYLRRHGDPAAQRLVLEAFRLEGIRTLIDSDGDGMDDAWEQEHGLVVGLDDSTERRDGSGMTNREQFLAGTDPNDSNSLLALTIEPAGDEPGAFDITWPSAPYRWYRVLRAPAPGGPYAPVSGPLHALPPCNHYRDRTASRDTASFYRLEILP